MTKTKVQLGIIQETLLIPLRARACELQQLNLIIWNPKFAHILQAIDDDFDTFATAKNSHIGAVYEE